MQAQGQFLKAFDLRAKLYHPFDLFANYGIHLINFGLSVHTPIHHLQVLFFALVVQCADLFENLLEDIRDFLHLRLRYLHPCHSTILSNLFDENGLWLPLFNIQSVFGDFQPFEYAICLLVHG